MYVLFGSGFLKQSKEKALKSQRRRAHYNMHDDYSDPVQRIAICMVKGTYIPPHFHCHEHQKELFVLLYGSVKFVFFDENGYVSDEIMLTAGEMVEVRPHAIHTAIVMSDYAHVLEVKQGPYFEKDSKEFPEWSMPESDPYTARYVSWLEMATKGEKYTGFTEDADSKAAHFSK